MASRSLQGTQDELVATLTRLAVRGGENCEAQACENGAERLRRRDPTVREHDVDAQQL